MKITKDQAEIMLKKMPEMAYEVYQDFPELKPSMVVDSWKDLGEITGFFIKEDSKIHKQALSLISCKAHKNIFKTQKQAESSLAYAQLTQLMADCGDCDIDWTTNQEKYCLEATVDGIETKEYSNYRSFLAFNTHEVRDKFMQKHEGLIKTFYQI